MKITVNRFVSDANSTISLIMVDGVFVCFGLEDQYQATKVAGETRIPAGTYRVGVRNVGGFDARYAVKFADIHDGMLHVLDVPGFEYILIHVGNTDADTAGCLLVGEMTDPKPGAMMIGRSVAAYRTFYPMVIAAAKAGDLTIEYIDQDRSA
ncbi:DUF5675 family protein [Thalassospira lohafexi]|uniref:DUF5675 domain-containing protein n=1 Tax=Thalassospira lohafexi TaxID=744227 RepID=A0A2N3L484_9PROT|nr:DUF5675 family protein [Thalassospira lohafexi]PKR57517.1 hypothetical protein COO92_16380 [Thalassospira lohafexi]